MSSLETEQNGSKYSEQAPAATQHILYIFEVALVAMAALLTRPFAAALGLVDQLLIEEHRRLF